MIATSVSLDGLTMAYRGQDQPVVDGISLDVEPGDVTVLLGPSGCGKTTTLKLVAGLLTPDRGDIRFDDASVLGDAAERRAVAMVFQKPLLFPHMTVGENVGFGLRVRGTARREARAEIDRMLVLVQLPDMAALVVQPKVLLLDEPLSQLDASLRTEMRELVSQVQRSVGVTTMFVTHDQEEAVQVADRIALMFDGAIEQHDVPRAFYDRPATARVARFFGARNLIVGRTDGGRFLSAFGAIDLAGVPPAGPGLLVVRPEAIRLASGDGPNVVAGRVVHARFQGDRVTVHLEVGKTALDLTVAPSERVAVGDLVRVLLPREACWVVPASD